LIISEDGFSFISLSHHSSDIFPAEHGVSGKEKLIERQAHPALSQHFVCKSFFGCFDCALLGVAWEAVFLSNFACLRLLALRFGARNVFVATV
jgi:hypothetical protein